MEYKIMSYDACERYATQYHSKSSAVISIYSPFFPKANVFCSEENKIKEVLPLAFCDSDLDPQLMCIRDTPEKGLITESQAMEIYEFCKKWYDKVDMLIFHCEGGISRSAGCAAAICRWFEGDDYPIFKLKSKHPNMYCYNKVLDACRGITNKRVSRILPEK